MLLVAYVSLLVTSELFSDSCVVILERLHGSIFSLKHLKIELRVIIKVFLMFLSTVVKMPCNVEDTSSDF